MGRLRVYSHYGASFNETYHALVSDVGKYGHLNAPRGYKCMELRPAVFTIAHAAKSLYTGASRRLNYCFWALETLSYIAGWGGQRYAELLCTVNPHMAPFVNSHTRSFDGAYGPRLAKSLPAIEELLQRDPCSRQAVASIWSPGLAPASLDVPCTLSLQFYTEPIDTDTLLKPMLSATGVMRSNDLKLGTPYDVAAFAAIQCLLAGCLGLPVGKYNHVASSLHYYTEDFGGEPRIEPPATETFIDHLRIPQLTTQEPFLSIMSKAGILLGYAHNHFVINKNKRADFVCEELEMDQEVNQRYWVAWSDLIRYTWEQANA